MTLEFHIDTIAGEARRVREVMYMLSDRLPPHARTKLIDIAITLENAVVRMKDAIGTGWSSAGTVDGASVMPRYGGVLCRDTVDDANGEVIEVVDDEHGYSAIMLMDGHKYPFRHNREKNPGHFEWRGRFFDTINEMANAIRSQTAVKGVDTGRFVKGQLVIAIHDETGHADRGSPELALRKGAVMTVDQSGNDHVMFQEYPGYSFEESGFDPLQDKSSVVDIEAFRELQSEWSWLRSAMAMSSAERDGNLIRLREEFNQERDSNKLKFAECNGRFEAQIDNAHELRQKFEALSQSVLAHMESVKGRLPLPPDSFTVQAALNYDHKIALLEERCNKLSQISSSYADEFRAKIKAVDVEACAAMRHDITRHGDSLALAHKKITALEKSQKQLYSASSNACNILTKNVKLQNDAINEVVKRLDEIQSIRDDVDALSDLDEWQNKSIGDILRRLDEMQGKQPDRGVDDGDDPITVEFLASVGFLELANAPHVWADKNVEMKLWRVAKSHLLWESNKVIARWLENRRDFRNLCSILRIKLKETK